MADQAAIDVVETSLLFPDEALTYAYLRDWLLNNPTHYKGVVDALSDRHHYSIAVQLNNDIGKELVKAQVDIANGPSFLSRWGLPIALAGCGLALMFYFSGKKKRRR